MLESNLLTSAKEEKRKDNETLALVENSSTPTTPTVVLLSPSLTLLSLSAVGELEETEFQLPSLTALPFHRTKSISDLPERARQFSSLSAPHVIQEICREKIPEWKNLNSNDIQVDQIMSGLSNQLFKVQIREDHVDYSSFIYQVVLFRIYGKDVNSLYDSSVELQVFKLLGRRGIAPRLVAEFEGGRIEEWIEGSALLLCDMKKTSVLLGVAQIIAGIHSTNLLGCIDATPAVDKFLYRWREGAMKIYKNIQPNHPSYLAIQRLDLPALYKESFYLHDYLFPQGIPENEVTQLCFCHNDIQENNIMLSESSMRLIDFEYSGYNYPAFDIASYFWEMTCDYCIDTYPFFRIDPTKYPLIDKRRLFCAMYLSKLTHTTVKKSSIDKLDPILDAVERFQLAIHMLWGFWSVIRAPQAATATSFDMLYYAQKRIDAYWGQKAKLMAEQKIVCPTKNTCNSDTTLYMLLNNDLDTKMHYAGIIVSKELARLEVYVDLLALKSYSNLMYASTVKVE